MIIYLKVDVIKNHNMVDHYDSCIFWCIIPAIISMFLFMYIFDSCYSWIYSIPWQKISSCELLSESDITTGTSVNSILWILWRKIPHHELNPMELFYKVYFYQKLYITCSCSYKASLIFYSNLYEVQYCCSSTFTSFVLLSWHVISLHK